MPGHAARILPEPSPPPDGAREGVPSGPFATPQLAASVDAIRSHINQFNVRAPASMTFQCAGLECRADLRKVSGRTVLTLTCTLGYLPYSAENPAGRRAALDLIMDCPHQPGGLLSVDNRGRIVFSGNTALSDADISGERLVGCLTVIMLQIRKDLGELVAILC